MFSPGFLHRVGGNKVYSLSVHVPVLLLAKMENNRPTTVDAELSYTGMYH